MSAETKMQSDPVERLKRALSGPRRDHKFFVDYVRELELYRTEDDIFIRLAFRHVGGDSPFQGSDLYVTSVYSEWYEPLGTERKSEVRRWWHEKTRWEAGQFDDLKARLSKLLDPPYDPVIEILLPYPFTGQADSEVCVTRAAMAKGEDWVKAGIEGWFRDHPRLQPGTRERIPEYQFAPHLRQPEG